MIPNNNPPYDRDAELAILGSILYENSTIDEIIDRISPESFYIPAHRKIFLSMIALHSLGNPIDEVLLGEKLGYSLSDAGGMEYLITLMDYSPEAGNISHYVDIVVEKYTAREYLKINHEGNQNVDNPEQSINESISKLTELGDTLVNKPDFHTAEDILKNVFIKLEEVSQNTDEIVGYPSGFTDLDKITSGFHDTDYIVLAARTAMGKTALALNIVDYVSTRANKKNKVLVFSYEMSKEQLMLRMLSARAKIDSTILKTGNIPQDDWDKLALATHELNNTELIINDSMPSLEQLKSIIRKESKNGKISLIVIDYLQLINLANKRGNRQEDVSEISRTMKLIAKQNDCCLLVLAQLNRALESRSNKKPILSDLRESGSIEQDADMIMFIYRDEIYNEDSKDKGTAELIIAKHRNGALGNVKLSFFGKYTKFTNLMSSNYY